jgi:glycosyltransferase involved in cell wall biosynthesis
MTNIAIVHDYLTQRGGAERLVIEMLRAFPGAATHTMLYDPEGTFPEFAEFEINVSPLKRIGALRADPRRALPLLAPTMSLTRVEADVALCSSSGWAHGVRASGVKIVYCHNTARWLFQREEYLCAAHRAIRLGLQAISPALRTWDRRAAASADHYVVNSEVVAKRVRDAYGIDASVIYPCRCIEPDGEAVQPIDIEPGFVLSIARLLPYKNLDVVISALEHLDGVELVVVGAGPDEQRLRRLADGRSVHFLLRRSDAELRWLLRNCGVVASMAFEDFGMVPVEAAGFGKPVVALRWGGFLETVIEGETGVFVDEPDAAQVAAGLRSALATSWDEIRIRTQGDRFRPEEFRRQLLELVDEWS